MQANLSSEPPKAEIQPPAAADWLWRPWYAKLWWAAIPIYWAGAVASLKVPALAAFYDSVPAAYLNMLFFPLTALLVLGLGYARAWLDARPDDDVILTGEDIEELERVRMLEEQWARRPKPVGDIYDPMSGTLYVCNPFGPNSGNPN